MGKKLLTMTLLSALGMSTFLMAGCGQNPSFNSGPSSNSSHVFNDEEDEPYVQELRLVSPPTKTTYNAGDVFDPSGILLEATWSHVDDETGKNIVEELGPYDINYSKEPLTEDATKVTVSYENKSIDIPIEIKNIAVTELVILVQPNMINFSVNDKFTLEGMILQVTFEDGTKRTLESGYTVTENGKDITSQIMSGGLTFTEGTHTITITFRGKSVSFDINVYDGLVYKVEAEKVLGSSKYPSVSETDRNYIETNQAYGFKSDNESKYLVSKSGEPASGGAYLGEFNGKGKGVTVHVYSEVETTAIVSMCASSGVIIEHASGANWTPTKMADLQLNQIIKVEGNGSAISMSDDVILPGGDIEDVGEGNNGLLWVNWQKVDLGRINLNKGDNQIYIEVINVIPHGGVNPNGGSGAMNLDYFDIVLDN